MKQIDAKSWLYFSLYIILLFVTAATRDMGLYPLISHESATLAAFVEPAWKLVFWIIPLLLFLRYNIKGSIISYLKLNRHVIRGLVCGLLISVYFLLRVASFLLHGVQINLHHSLNDWLNSVILVGLIEETVFRGFLYQWFQQALALNERMRRKMFASFLNETEDPGESPLLLKIQKWMPERSEIYAALFSTLLFAGVHFPSWIQKGVPLEIMVTTSAFNIFLGLVECAVLKYSESLWACIIIHTVNDLVLLLF